MSDKIKIEVFGIRNQSVGCDCEGECAPSKSMGEMYEDLLDYLRRKQLSDHVDTKFIDIIMEDLDEYPYAEEALTKGHGLPLTAVNGKVKFFNGISNRMVFDAVNKLIQS